MLNTVNKSVKCSSSSAQGAFCLNKQRVVRKPERFRFGLCGRLVLRFARVFYVLSCFTAGFYLFLWCWIVIVVVWLLVVDMWEQDQEKKGFTFSLNCLLSPHFLFTPPPAALKHKYLLNNPLPSCFLIFLHLLQESVNSVSNRPLGSLEVT